MGLLDEFSYAPSLLMADAFPLTSQYRPDLPKAKAKRGDFGLRHSFIDGAKGYGWLGPIPTADGVMTEFSATHKGKDFPMLVPTLTKREVSYMQTAPQGVPSIPTKDRATDDSVYRKALEWAALRRAQGLSPFID